MTNRYAATLFSPLESAAIDWLNGFYQLEHLLSTRYWVTILAPAASPALKFAALVHDAERFFPGGPSGDARAGFDDCDYLFAHSIRSADIVEAWLRGPAKTQDETFIRHVRKLILRHEIGGNSEEDILQAADSLAFLDVFDWLIAQWVRNGLFSPDQAREKLDWSVERIRPPTARRLAMPLYAQITKALDPANPIDIAGRKAEASDRKRLIGK
jgi:hypothetical protein